MTPIGDAVARTKNGLWAFAKKVGNKVSSAFKKSSKHAEAPNANAPQFGGTGLTGATGIANAGTKKSNGPIQQTIGNIVGPAPRLHPRGPFNNRHGRLPTSGPNGTPNYIEYEVPNPNLPPGSVNDWRLYYDQVNKKWFYSGNSHAGGKPGSGPSGSEATFVEIVGVPPAY